jgi:uncharacterized membrane protein YcaP (DUF421 family)
MIAGWLQFVFGGDRPIEPLHWHQVMARAVVVYVIGVLLVRAGKSRLIARLSPLDVLIGFILGSLLSRGITGHASISGTAASSAALVFVHWLFTWLACRYHWFGRFVKGNMDLVVEDGVVFEQALARHHLSRNDLEQQLRQNGISDVSDVHLAYKERSGEISVIRSKQPPRVLEVEVQPGVQTVRIQLE